MKELTPKLQAKISLLPDSPGCYLMKDEGGRIIYVGKAKSLVKRVSQYFLRPQEGKVEGMVERVDDFDFILVHTEQEAFILEMNLIKTYRPRFNIMLMDDSHYPYIALSRAEGFLKISRSTTDKRFIYFGPFPGGKECYQTISLLNSLLPTRKCNPLGKKKCLYFHLHQCLAPCENKIEEGEIEKLISSVKKFLNGDVSEALSILKQRMDEASEEERYEDALEIKKEIEAIKKTVERQAVETGTSSKNRDVFAFSMREGYLAVSVLNYIHGRLLGKKVEVVSSFGDENEQAKDLVESYYASHPLPSEVVSGMSGLKERLEEDFPGLSFIVPKEGIPYEQTSLASLNAKQGLDAHFMTARLEDDKSALLDELGTLLSIPTPYRIELFDNSHLEGSNAVGAMVCFINGEKAKGMYRKFTLSKEVGGDDFHSMEEVVERRYRRLKDEKASYPDLILTDGGISQVRAAIQGLRKADVDIPVFGLFKNEKHETKGLVGQDGKEYPLNSSSPLFFLLMRMQDEVHRFAITFHKSLRSKNAAASVFSSIPGLGRKREETLRLHYPSLDALKNASEEELGQFLPAEAAHELFLRIRSLK